MLNALTHPSFVAKLVDKVISPSSRIAVPSVLDRVGFIRKLSHEFLGISLVFGTHTIHSHDGVRFPHISLGNYKDIVC